MCRIKGSVIGLGSRVGDGVVIEDSLIFGSDMHLQAKAQAQVHTLVCLFVCLFVC